jgi:hypothetical protein
VTRPLVSLYGMRTASAAKEVVMKDFYPKNGANRPDCIALLSAYKLLR